MTTATENKQLTVKKADGVAEFHIHVNKTTAYDLDYYKELKAAIADLRFDQDIKTVILMSDMPKCFSAGANIQFLKQADPNFKTPFCLFCNETLDKIAHSPQIWIACL